MEFTFNWLNCLWLIIPLLVWNLVFGPKLSQEALTSDKHVPIWLSVIENMLRMAVFALPVLMALTWGSRMSQIGMGVYLVGTAIYFASWIPLLAAPDSAWSVSRPGLLAPYATPLLVFVGIALIGDSWIYAILALAFVGTHVGHGLYALQVL